MVVSQKMLPSPIPHSNIQNPTETRLSPAPHLATLKNLAFHRPATHPIPPSWVSESLPWKHPMPVPPHLPLKRICRPQSSLFRTWWSAFTFTSRSLEGTCQLFYTLLTRKLLRFRRQVGFRNRWFTSYSVYSFRIALGPENGTYPIWKIGYDSMFRFSKFQNCSGGDILSHLGCRNPMANVTSAWTAQDTKH